MKPFGKRFRLGLLLGFASLVAFGAILTWRVLQTRQRVTEYLPARPNLNAAPAVLVERIDSAERRARESWRPVGALAELARLYHANGFLPEARTCVEGLVQVDDANPRWPYLLANILGGFGELEETLSLLRRSVSLEDDYVPARIKLGDALLKLNQPAEAARVYSEALTRDPTNAYALLGLARRELVAANWTAARERLRQIVAARPKFGAAWALLATVDDHLGDKAAAALDRAKESSSGGVDEMPDPWIDALLDDCYDPYRLRIAADVLASDEDPSKALVLLQRATAIAPQDAPAHRQLGQFLAKIKRVPEARAQLERATVLDPKDADNWNFLIKVLNESGDAEAASRALAQGLSHCPISPGLHLEKGRRLAAAGQFDLAAVEFEETRRLRPEESNASVELAMTYFRRGRLEEGMIEIRRALAVDPEQPIALVLLARYSINSGDESAAREWIRRSRLQSKVLPPDLTLVVDEYRRKFGREP